MPHVRREKRKDQKKRKHPTRIYIKKKKEKPRGRQGHRPENTADTRSELRFHTIFIFVIAHIISIFVCSNVHICRMPREIIVEQGLHPNPGPGEGRRRLKTKTKPEDAGKIEDAKIKESSKAVHPQLPPLSTEGTRVFSKREGGQEAIDGGREPGHTKNSPL